MKNKRYKKELKKFVNNLTDTQAKKLFTEIENISSHYFKCPFTILFTVFDSEEAIKTKKKKMKLKMGGHPSVSDLEEEWVARGTKKMRKDIEKLLLKRIIG